MDKIKFSMKKALFLDRDGVINIDKNYVYQINDFEFRYEIFDLCKDYQEKGYCIIVITNQAGIARGYYSHDDFNILTNWMIEQFDLKGIHIAKVYYCPHHPNFTGDCYCRKPNPGMILQASKEFDLDLSQCILIGDKISDIQAGHSAGITKTYLIQDNTFEMVLK
ncbi:D-glycero-alpha-D-manno-heptose-1,7-bisphosphate 7-phosphatase [Emticicia sediminis]